MKKCSLGTSDSINVVTISCIAKQGISIMLTTIYIYIHSCNSLVLSALEYSGLITDTADRTHTITKRSLHIPTC